MGLREKAANFLEKTFAAISAGTWQCLPELPSNKHHYSPACELVDPPITLIPLNFENSLQKLKKELAALFKLLKQRRESFLKHKSWEESDEELSSEDDSDQEYIVDAIISHKFENGKIFYKVSWKYYPGETNWLPEDKCAQMSEIIKDYKDSLK